MFDHLKHLFTVRMYFCDTPACGHIREQDMEFDPVTDETYCPYCGCDDGIKRADDRWAEWVTIAAYDTSREYGGPEEGGWYYTSGTPIPGTAREFPRAEFPQALIYREYLQRDHDCVRVTTEAKANSFPSSRPTYC